VAGNNDDCVDGGTPQNGCLITVGTELNGASSDPYSTLLPLYADDHERYNLTPQIPLGSTVITVNTANGSQDDNIFAAVFRISGDASVTTNNAPEPATFVLSGIALAGLGFLKLRRRSA
jgi:hypothetical protein